LDAALACAVPAASRGYDNSVSARKMRRAAITGLLSVSFLAGCGHAAAPGPPTVMMSYCGSDSQPAPAIVEVVCNTDDITARNLAWSAWGKPTATAKGVAVIDQCAYEDCHTGSFGTVPIRLIAARIAACGKNKQRFYTTLRYVFIDGSPRPGVPADMNTSHYMSSPGRPLPPPDQTVALTCG
jgi:hypothetical protein